VANLNVDLTKGLNRAKQSKTIEFLVKHASADINPTRRDSLAAVHVAMFDNYIDALELLEDIGADMMSFGAVGQTPVRIAYYNGHGIPVDHSSDTLLSYKDYSKRSGIWKRRL
jgi:ankyrin repeat protein